MENHLKKDKFLKRLLFLLLALILISGISLIFLSLFDATPHNSQENAVSPSVNNNEAAAGGPSIINTTDNEEGIVIAAAGDIACDPGSNSGAPKNCDQDSTAKIVEGLDPAAVLTLGDTQYEKNTLAAYMEVFDKSWGKFKEIIHPAIGNHEYLTKNAQGYFDYFSSAAGDPEKGYYSFDIGDWHFIALNSECSHIGGCGKGSEEEKWLMQDLASHNNLCTLAYWHEPRWSSGEHGDAKQMDAIWKDIAAAHVDLVLSGHNHDYERFVPMDGNGRPASDGTIEFVVGTGGKNKYRFTAPASAGEVVRDDTSYGVLKLTLKTGSFGWQFIPADTAFIDSGTAACN
jgi:hypothetical protein